MEPWVQFEVDEMSIKKTQVKIDRINDLLALDAKVKQTMGEEVDTYVIRRQIINNRKILAESIGRKNTNDTRRHQHR